MERELADRAKAAVGAELRRGQADPRCDTFVKVRRSQQLCAQKQSRAGGRESARQRSIPSVTSERHPTSLRPDRDSHDSCESRLMRACRRTFGVSSAAPRYPFIQSTLCSYACASANSVDSSQCRPININPTGSPSDFAHGTLIAGCPVISNGAVLPIIE
jgi:hypothetical protein